MVPSIYVKKDLRVDVGNGDLVLCVLFLLSDAVGGQWFVQTHSVSCSESQSHILSHMPRGKRMG